MKETDAAGLKLEETALFGAILPLQCFFSKPVSFAEASQVDRLSIGHVFPGYINLGNEQKCENRRLKRRVMWQEGRWNTSDKRKGEGLTICGRRGRGVSFWEGQHLICTSHKRDVWTIEDGRLITLLQLRFNGGVTDISVCLRGAPNRWQSFPCSLAGTADHFSSQMTRE